LSAHWAVGAINSFVHGITISVKNMFTIREENQGVIDEFLLANHTDVFISDVMWERRPHKLIPIELGVSCVTVLPENCHINIAIVIISEISLSDKLCSLSCNKVRLGISNGSLQNSSLSVHQKKLVQINLKVDF
jgi:hypothetical protein